MKRCYFIAIFLTIFHISPVFSQSCTALPDRNLTVFVGWPYNLACNHDLILNNDISSKCLVNNGSSSSIINLNEEDINKDIYYNLTLRFLNDSCKSWRVLVKAENIPTLSLQEDALFHKNITSLKFNYSQTVVSDSVRLKCIKENSEFYYPAGDYKIRWYQTEFHQNGSVQETYNVSKYPQNFHYSDDDKILQINPGFYEAGIFSCEVRYKGTNLVTSHTQLCIKQRTVEMHPLLQCIDEINFDKGNSRNITCIAQIDSKIISDGGIKVTWFRRTSGDKEDIICENTKLDEMKKLDGADCQTNYLRNKERKCFEYVPDDGEVESAQESLPVSLLLKNLQRGDAGKIYVRLEHRNRISDVKEIQLNFNYLDVIYTVIGVLSAVLVFSFICGFIGYRYRHPILLKFRRHFGKYDKDDKEYVAILSYVYNGQFDQESRESVKKMITWTKNLFEKKNYNYYDAQEQMELGPWAETFIRNLDKSHRMIVFMTAEYVQEAKARFETKQALENMRKNKTKIIVVKTKGAKKALKSKRDIKFKRELYDAISGMRNVNYRHGMSETEFSDMMDYALPNLDRSPKSDESEERQIEGSLNPSFTSTGPTIDSTVL